MFNKFFNSNDISNMALTEVIDRIITLTKGICQFWSKAGGWAPPDAADILNRSRLDWHNSLTEYLENWIIKDYNESDHGSLILAWVNLGSVVEGTLKLSLSVFYEDYLNDDDRIIYRGIAQDPDGLKFDKLRIFCNGKLWDESSTWNEWILHIQQRRNVIHAFKDREIGNFAEFHNALKMYLKFLRMINGILPYPDEIFAPREI